MDNNLDKQIIDARLACEKANLELERLLVKKNEFPRLEKVARTLLRVGHSDSYVESRLYATRGQNISIEDISGIITDVKKSIEILSKGADVSNFGNPVDYQKEIREDRNLS